MSWHDGYRVWLTESQSLANAQKVVDHLYGDTDWSREAMCALIGNMRHESSINPDMYEYGYAWGADRGYGLVQWTPRSKYWDWATQNGKAPRSGESQLDRIDYEVSNNIQWIPRSDYGRMTFAQFRSNSGDWSIAHLTEAFTWGYERPNAQAGWNSMPDRKSFARLAYDELEWSGDGGGGPTDPPGDDDDGGDDGDTGGSVSITYLVASGDSVYIHLDNSQKIRAVPTTANRWKAEANSFGSGGDNGGGDNGGGDDDPGDDDPGDDGDPPPVTGEWSNPLGNQRCTQAWGRTQWTSYHSGIDMGAKTPGVAGDPMYALTSGVVERVGGHQQVLVAHSGNGFIINHGDINGDTMYSYYGHCESVAVSVGDTVEAGDLVAYMGGSGANPNDFAVHLHMTIYKNVPTNTNGATSIGSGAIDPEPYLKGKGILQGMNTCPR